MSIDVEAIKAKLEKLQNKNQKKKFTSKRWKPELGEHMVRALPWRDCPPDSPIKELQFYFNIGKFPIVTPHQFVKPDPIQDFREQLLSENKETRDKETWLLAQKLKPSTRGFLRIIVRGKEDEGVKLWSFSPTIYNRFYEFMVDPEIGDFLDLRNGFDLKVKVYKQEGKKFQETLVECGRTKKPISTDQKKMNEWYGTEIDLMEEYQLKSYDEIKKSLDDWLNPEDAEKKEMEMNFEDKKDEVSDLLGDLADTSDSKEDGEVNTDKEFSNMDDVFDEVMKDDD